jgi:hypothetical protein
MSTMQAVSATRNKPRGIRPYLPGRRVGEPLCDVPSASLLARRVLRLFYTCDRVDGLPEGRIRDEAMAELLERVARFQQEERVDQNAALQEAMAMVD